MAKFTTCLISRKSCKRQIVSPLRTLGRSLLLGRERKASAVWKVAELEVATDPVDLPHASDAGIRTGRQLRYRGSHVRTGEHRPFVRRLIMADAAQIGGCAGDRAAECSSLFVIEKLLRTGDAHSERDHIVVCGLGQGRRCNSHQSCCQNIAIHWEPPSLAQLRLDMAAEPHNRANLSPIRTSPYLSLI